LIDRKKLSDSEIENKLKELKD